MADNDYYSVEKIRKRYGLRGGFNQDTGSSEADLAHMLIHYDNLAASVNQRPLEPTSYQWIKKDPAPATITGIGRAPKERLVQLQPWHDLLLAVSDRGRLFNIMMRPEPGRFQVSVSPIWESHVGIGGEIA